MSHTKEETRSHVHELAIGADAETIWKAITEAEELVRWFPLEAEVVPGPGGSLTYHWGEQIEGVCHVQAWEPCRWLRTSWLEPTAPSPAEGGDGGGRTLVVDWHLRAEVGTTRLRLVHSGFGTGEQWDGEYDGTRRGWDFELFSLKHYLEHHRGKERRCFWLRRPVELPADEVWRRLTGPGGLFADGGDVEGLRAGEAFERTLASGDRLEGTVVLCEPPRELAFTARSLGNGLVRLGYEDCGMAPSAHLWLSTWGLPAREVDDLRARWEPLLENALGVLPG